MIALFKKLFKKHKNRNKKLPHMGTILIVLIVALGLMGTAYASWTQQFNIFSAISTGELNVEIKDAVLESSSSHQSLSFSARKDGDMVDEVHMDVVTNANPFTAVVVFSVENNGTIPVICSGVEQTAAGDLTVEIVSAPPRIDVGETEPVRVRVAKGYCDDFEFSALLKFEQYNAVN